MEKSLEEILQGLLDRVRAGENVDVVLIEENEQGDMEMYSTLEDEETAEVIDRVIEIYNL